MIRYKYYSFLWVMVLMGALTVSCKKEFTTDPTPTDAVSAADVFKTAQGVRVYFSGIYRNMRSQWALLDGSLVSRTDIWGYNSINLARVVKGTDIIAGKSNWYQFDYVHDNREPAYRRTVFTWGFFYEFINQLNVLIDGVTNSATIEENDKTLLIAEARALRGWFYFELVREFQHTYAKDPNAPGVPVYTEPTSVTNPGKPRGTLKQVFDQINGDIEFATQNLGTTRDLKSAVNINVAWGMAARIYLEQQRWADAKAAAQKARAGYALDPGSYPDGFGALSSSETIWGFPQAADIGGQTLYYGTPSSFFDKTGEGYDNFFISSELVSLFSNTDIRNTFFITDPSVSSPDHFATNKFGAPTDEDIELVSGEVVKLKTINFDEALPMMRSAEMLLIEAEAKAELSEADANDLLYQLQVNRDPSAVKSGKTGQALVSEILLERRKELYGELGINFLDIKRRQLPLVRTGNHATPYKLNYPANDKRFRLKIPQKEFDSNTMLNAATDQND